MAEEETREKTIVIPELITVRQLANLLGVSAVEVVKVLISLSIMANINQTIDHETASIVAAEMGFEPKEEPLPVKEEVAVPSVVVEAPIKEMYAKEAPESLEPRPPVVTVMGHVDHGKTTLLDAIRHTNVVADEVGGITQEIGAHQVEREGRKITFIDTPGHEAFTAMRARGAQVTDIAILVVAADDGVMPQTKEAIDHARAARVPIIVALNKIDKKEADPDRVKRQLAELGLVVEEQGGKVICVPISAKKGTGIDALLEMVLLVADLSDLKANPSRLAEGTVIEGRLDKARGPMATVLVQNGTLKMGDYVIVGDVYGRVRAMFNDAGKRVKKAEPSTPVAILGLAEVPLAGETFEAAEDERTARSLVVSRREEQARPGVPARLSLEELYTQMQAGKMKELLIILKADTQGSLEAVRASLEKLGDEGLKVRVIHEGIGSITESDVNLAIASRAIIIGFGVEADPIARSRAESEGIEIRCYDIIYQLLEDIDKALKGLLEPVYKEVTLGRAQVKAVFQVRRGKVAGASVKEGIIRRNAKARLVRNGEALYEGQVVSLKRFTEDVKEVSAGLECGIGLDGFQDFEVGDVIEIYTKERVG